ncbi:MAG: DUF1614 domain-containing protein [Dethiobacter sp.]|jgi:uncharacterized membrane protein|nr:MAG: DUF1614 domain-containing protein [Dethiobacter sp.]
MRTNSLAITVLILLLVLIYLGFLERVLERMRLTRTQALLILLAMVLGGGLPVLPLARGLKINLGGMVILLIVVIYLVATADEKAERVRTLITITVTVVAVWIVDRLFPLEPGLFFLDIDPLYLPALVAAVVAYILGRSRRAAFIGAFLGVLFVDLIAWGENLVRGFGNVTVVLGGGGVFGAAVLSGVLAVLLAEIVGEIRERLHRT